ncbi:hypothetical protein SAMN02745165_01029 [Malonomonas rubra DSM 5091]|uniref:Uncharacterized protein n=1 Tax=Malonomonas rubra DSM 5091 TaxID=1122189 RepID=A0A1M6ETW4_MALRU|nr:hypothetical protein [Malonomonas rubra]SHI88816.1 hypothetical protein SAMN02745165_01029 [Malonomonas rubra DSM 5091]
MLIPVIYPNGSHDQVKDFYLDFLIREEKIDQFKRSSGWVSIFDHNIRGKKTSSAYNGPERRQSLLDKEETPSNEIEFYPPA